MADFCNYCSERIFGGNAKPEIEEFYKLEPGWAHHVLCEGCSLITILRTVNNELKVIYADNTDNCVDYYDKSNES